MIFVAGTDEYTARRNTVLPIPLVVTLIILRINAHAHLLPIFNLQLRLKRLL